MGSSNTVIVNPWLYQGTVLVPADGEWEGRRSLRMPCGSWLQPTFGFAGAGLDGGCGAER